MPAYRTATSGKDRTVALIAVAAVHAALIALLLSQHQRPMPKPATTDTTLINVNESPQPPPPPETVKPDKTREAEGAAGKKARPSKVVAPPPKLPAPSPVAAAPVAGTGTAPSAGAATSGSGTGAGGSGSGSGGGGGGGSGAQWISGGLRDSDYPRGLVRDRVGGTVSVRFTVLTSGRIADCRIVRSSGSSILDQTTCRLLTDRLRFRPATDGSGQPVASSLGSDFTWGVRVRR